MCFEENTNTPFDLSCSSLTVGLVNSSALYLSANHNTHFKNNNIYMQYDTVRHIIILASISCAHSVQRLRIIFIFVIESAVSITLLYDLYNDGVFLRL
jgi:hypothetical protein